MKNYNDEKRRKIARIICIVLVICMILSVAVPFFSLFN